MSGCWRCDGCGRTYELGAVEYVCWVCGPAGLLTYLPDLEALQGWTPSEKGDALTRFARLLPVAGWLEQLAMVSQAMPVGGTPLHRLRRLGDKLGLPDLWLKNEGLNPSGALKDRPSALVAVAALAKSHPVVATASSGNAAAALAAVSAAVGLDCVVFVPAHTAVVKLAQISAYGARVVVADGDYDVAADLCRAASEEFGWYCRNTAINPFTTEGKKTVALEVATVMAPDVVVVPVGDGNMLYGLSRGFANAADLGWLARPPRLIGVQARGADAVWRAFHSGATSVVTGQAETVADSISVGTPADGWRAVRAVRDTGGTIMAADDDAILQAAAELACTSGVLVEAASAATVAVLRELVRDGAVTPAEKVVVIGSGSGLKTIPAAPALPRVKPTVTAVAAYLQM